jgi:hypothetical protein
MITLILITLSILIGLIGYLHYVMDKQRKELDRLWAQIALLALTTAKRIIETEEKINKNDK